MFLDIFKNYITLKFKIFFEFEFKKMFVLKVLFKVYLLIFDNFLKIVLNKKNIVYYITLPVFGKNNI